MLKCKICDIEFKKLKSIIQKDINICYKCLIKTNDNKIDKINIDKSNKIIVIKRDAREEELNINKIYTRLEILLDGLDESYINLVDTVKKIIEGLKNGIKTSEIDILSYETCAYMSHIHPDYSILAARIAISNLHKMTSNSFYETCEKLYLYEDYNNNIISLIDDNFYKFVKANKEKLDEVIDYNRDYYYDYFGFKTLEKSYLLKIDGKIVERPQHLLMRVACSIHNDDLNAALETYNFMSQKYFTHASTTLFNAGLKRQQFSSCFLMTIKEDSIEGIYDTLKQCAQISKSAGGIGLSISNVRAKGSFIKGTNGYSNGIIPMLKNFNETARYVDQGGGKRKGSFAVYIEPWHLDIFDFLELRKNTGKEEFRARDLFLGLWIPDLFMERVKNEEDWTLFCPSKTYNKENIGLWDLYGEEFNDWYLYLEKKGLGKKIRARELWHAIINSQIETGTPYMLYKDQSNKKSNQKNIGTIHSSNLCTEIIEYNDSNEIAVCNLASIALNSFINIEKNEYNFNKLFDIVRIVTRNLNKIIDKSYYPVEEAKKSNLKHRPIGIGVQGLADTFAIMKYPYESDEAKKLNIKIFETIYYAACYESVELAIQYGAYESFEGSPLSQGLFQFDLWNKQLIEPMWDWNNLREKIKKNGIRNSLLIALMPTASTAQILGNNESFEPFTQNIYVRRTLAGEFLQINKYLVRDLIKLNLWNDNIKNKLILNNGSVLKLDIPDNLKEIYKTVWEIKQKNIIEMTADRAIYVDQSQSLNIHMIDINYSKLTSMHFYGWMLGLKTGMYYLRTKAAADPIKITLEVENKYSCINCSS